MDNGFARDGAAYLKNLTLYAFPEAQDLDDAPGRFRRRWLLRVRSSLPAGPALDQAVDTLRDAAANTIIDAYGDAARDPVNLPAVRGVFGDDTHLVLEIDCPTHDVAVGDSVAVATWSILRGADELWGIEELEGIPKQYWFPLT